MMIIKKVKTFERIIERLQKEIIKELKRYTKLNLYTEPLTDVKINQIIEQATIKGNKLIDYIMLKQYMIGQKIVNRYELNFEDKRIINRNADLLKAKLWKAIEEVKQDIKSKWKKSNNNRDEFIKQIDKGLTAFTDKAGRKWKFTSYMNMTVRTQALQTVNVGTLSEDWDLYQVSKEPTKCPICKKVLGKVFSKSGTNKKYPPLTKLFGKIDKNGADTLDNTYMCIHPNCIHRLYKYKEGVGRIPEGNNYEKQIEKARERFEKEYAEYKSFKNKAERLKWVREKYMQGRPNNSEKYERRMKATENYFKREYGSKWKEKMKASGYYV